MRRQRGIALVLVLWVTTLLAVIAASFVFSMRTDTLLAQNLVSSLRAQAAADAGVQRGVFELIRPESDSSRWQGNGVQHRWEFGDAKVDITLQNVSGKIDLNTAADALLKGLLKSVGLDEEKSNALLDAILDWRDSDDLRRINGAEAAEYQAAGLKYKPANAPFETVDELQRVLGMTPKIYAKLEDALTVDSRQAGINSAIASRNVLLSIPGVDAASVDTYLVLRQAVLTDKLPPPPFPQGAGFMAAANGSVYSVRAVAALPDGATFIRETMVSINQDAASKFVFLSWKEGAASAVPDGGENL